MLENLFKFAAGEISVWSEGSKGRIGAIRFTAMAIGVLIALETLELVASDEMLQLIKAAALLKSA